MVEKDGREILTDAAWAVWEPLIEAVWPRGKTAPKELRRTISAIFWRHQNGAKWRSIPAELGPWWLAAQLFIRWAKRGVWERLLDLVQQHDIALGMHLVAWIWQESSKIRYLWRLTDSEISSFFSG